MLSNVSLILRHKGVGGLVTALYYGARGAVGRRMFGQRFVHRHVRDFDMVIDLDDRGISRTLLLFGRREEEHVVILRQVLKRGMTVFDVGANIGYYVLIERGLIGTSGHIVAIEPSPSNVTLLRRNIALNRCENVSVLELAVSEAEGRQLFHLSHLSNLNTFHPGGSAAAHLNNRVIEVGIDTVPSIARKTGRKPDLIRMDVEGHEIEVMRGLLPAIEAGEMAPMILFETHLSRYTHDHDMEEPLRRLFRAGYRVRYAASASEKGTARLQRKGYRGGDPIETDMVERVVFENIAAEDAIELICRAGGIRAVLLSK